ncbi:MAG: fibronectin type III domain-containing protein [Planctomycetes bacterium]|nr:fibronectin type III domain-containing protein [Planctomycetota bacterium]
MKLPGFITGISLLLFQANVQEWNGIDKEVAASAENMVAKRNPTLTGSQYDVVYNTLSQKDVMAKSIYEGGLVSSASPIINHPTSDQWNPDFAYVPPSTQDPKLVVVCQDNRNGTSNIYANRVNKDYVKEWGTGVLIASSSSATLIEPKVTAVLKSSQYLSVVLYGEQDNITQNITLKLGIIKPDGNILNPPGIVTINPARQVSNWKINPIQPLAWSANTLVLVSWQEGGDIKMNIFKTDDLTSTINTAQGYTNGITVFGTLGNQSTESDYSVLTDSDASGNVAHFVCLSNQDGNNDVYFNSFQVQSATVRFPGYGINVSDSSVENFTPDFTNLNTGELIISWSTILQGSTTHDINAAKIKKITGSKEWDTTVCYAEGNQTRPKVLVNPDQAIFVLWEDLRAGGDKKIYGQLLSAFNGTSRFYEGNGDPGFQVGNTGNQSLEYVFPYGNDLVWVGYSNTQSVITGVATDDGTNVKPNKIPTAIQPQSTYLEVQISWNPTVSPLVSSGGSGVQGIISTGFKIERKSLYNSDPNNNQYIQIADIPNSAVPFHDSTVIPDSIYMYRIRLYARTSLPAWGSVTRDSHSEYTETLAVGIPGELNGQAPSSGVLPPSNLTATALSGSQIRLQWTNPLYPFPPPPQIEIKRAVGESGNFEFVGTIPYPASSYTDTGLQQRTLYKYKIRYRMGISISVAIGPASATTLEGEGGSGEPGSSNTSSSAFMSGQTSPIFIPDPPPPTAPPQSQPKSSTKNSVRKEGLCYIATRTTGSVNANSVIFMTKCRDRYFDSTIPGTFFTSIYSQSVQQIVYYLTIWFEYGYKDSFARYSLITFLIVSLFINIKRLLANY